MTIKKISSTFSVSDQPSLGDFVNFGATGFGSVINLRHDAEDPDQPSSEEERKAAQSAGVGFYHLPYALGDLTQADIEDFDRILASAEKPVLAHCKTGKRAAAIWLINEIIARREPLETVDLLTARLGLDLIEIRGWLQANHPEVFPASKAIIKGFYDARTGSIQYVVADRVTRKCAVIDPVLDFDEKSGSVATTNADAILAYVAEAELDIQWILDTHPHADHFSAAYYLKGKTGASMAIGKGVKKVQSLWKDIYDLPDSLYAHEYWDHLFSHEDTFMIGEIEARVIDSPGHTLASVSYVIDDAVFLHDTLFMPDSGTARADFPGGSAESLWRSIEALLAFPPETRLFTGHDYRPGGRLPLWESSVRQQVQSNIHIANRDKEAFIRMREDRDRTLPMPKLILHALQVNIRGGRLPEAENSKRFLKIPLNAFPDSPWE